MDFTWTPEQVELRERARKVATEAVARFGRHNDSWINGYSKEFAKELAAHGWIGMSCAEAIGVPIRRTPITTSTRLIA